MEWRKHTSQDGSREGTGHIVATISSGYPEPSNKVGTRTVIFIELFPCHRVSSEWKWSCWREESWTPNGSVDSCQSSSVNLLVSADCRCDYSSELIPQPGAVVDTTWFRGNFSGVLFSGLCCLWLSITLADSAQLLQTTVMTLEFGINCMRQRHNEYCNLFMCSGVIMIKAWYTHCLASWLSSDFHLESISLDVWSSALWSSHEWHHNCAMLVAVWELRWKFNSHRLVPSPRTRTSCCIWRLIQNVKKTWILNIGREMGKSFSFRRFREWKPLYCISSTHQTKPQIWKIKIETCVEFICE